MARLNAVAAANGTPKRATKSTKSSADLDFQKDQKTDYTRWRLLDESGRQTWHYLRTEDEVKEWPQTIADKYHLGMPTVCCHLRS